ncbi:MAG: hypothetical protein JWM28_2055 [Chitinophagaceae bacterium]|nr:hypothetical protein [Chitinophagaceae bacterium]
MDISEFVQLDINSRAALAWQGDFIADRIENGNSVQLYSINGFFAEICYNIIDEEIITVNPVKTSGTINIYSEKVDISSLMI